MKRKNAFTLMELLAVLVVLAIIALIIFPIIGDVIKDSKMKAFKSSVQGLADSAELDYQKDDYEGDRTYQYENGNLTLLKVGTTSKNENIKVEGLIENGVGRVYIDPDGEISLTVHNEDWCATKEITENTITIEEKTENNCSLPKTVKKVMESATGETAYDGTVDNNLRYVGPTPNNYVWFNNERWRIIGVFNGQTKIIRNDFYSTGIAWDSSSVNNWSTATLQTTLNGTYLNSIEATSKSYIDSTHVWNLGGAPSTTSERTRTKMYSYERGTEVCSGRPTTWTGAIGLMYPSDYGYATSSTNSTCNSTTMYDWDFGTAKTECAGNSWLYNSSVTQWTLTPLSDTSHYAFYVSTSGHVFDYHANLTYGVRPVLYLKSDTKIVGGQGTEQEPFELGI